MAKYSDIKGFTVQTLASDTIASQQAGGTWASGTAMSTARDYVAGWAEDSDACLIAGGSTNATELYNGTSWTEKNDMSAPGNPMYARHPVGTTTAALAAGGGSPYQSTVEQWDGTNWTEVGDLVTATSFGSNSPVGTTTAGLIAGGLLSGGAFSAINQTYNGSSWSDANELNEGRAYCAGLGTTTAALEVGGQPAGPTFGNKVEQWDGSSWTELSEFNTSRARGTAGGTTTSALFYGGAVGPSSTTTAVTEFWNGTSWTELSDLSTARQRGGGGGTLASAIMAGGRPPGSSPTNATEEWSAPATFNQQTIGQLFFNSTTNSFKETITDMAGATWASVPSLNTSTRYFCGGAGSTTAALICGGQSPVTNNTELFDGSSWTEVNEMNGSKSYHSVTGLQTAAMAVGGSPAPSFGTNNEQWNGSNWTESTESNDSTNDRAQCGITTAALFFGNSNNHTELWNGSAFTEGANMNNARGNLAGGGIQTLAIGANGYKAPFGSDEVELWDGSSWSETTESNTSRQSIRGAGTQTAFIMSMGNRPGGSPSLPGNTTSRYTEFWNGTSWTELNDMSTARYAGASSQGPASSSTSALYSGGYTGSGYSGASEEWTADVANKTITAS